MAWVTWPVIERVDDLARDLARQVVEGAPEAMEREAPGDPRRFERPPERCPEDRYSADELPHDCYEGSELAGEELLDTDGGSEDAP